MLSYSIQLLSVLTYSIGCTQYREYLLALVVVVVFQK